GRGIDYGFVGDIDKVDVSFFQSLLNQDLTIVVAPIMHDGNGQLLNTNADTVAQEIAKALSHDYDVNLIYSFEKNGVLENAADDATLLKKISSEKFKKMKADGAIFAGMIPKLDSAFAALNDGVKKVIIGKAENIRELIRGETGTTIIND
ncbi:MAG: acetylglutamate kinase, partial [Chitinophagaceae bacterium]|nr:acetylglutamate kinase [Chitinophagaceae bacterium]